MQKIVLILLFVVSVFGSDDKLGVPVIDWKKAPIESAVLAVDGESFYTLQGADLIQWNLSPLKKLSAWQVPLKKITTGKEQNRFHDIWFLDNYTKVLITSIEGMMIYNLKTHKVEKEVAYRSYSLVKDGNFIYLSHPTHIKDNRYNIDLEVWSIPELKRVKSVNITEMWEKYIGVCYIDEAGTESDNCPIEHLVPFALGSKNIYYPTISYDSAIVLNKSTLKFQGTIEQYSNIFEILEGGYLNTGSAIYRLSDDKHIEYKRRGWGFKEDYHLKVVQDLRVKPKRYSNIGKLFLKAQINTYPYMFTKHLTKKEIRYILSQYNEELVIKPKDNRKYFFNSSSRNTKLLQMKNKDGKVVPMNDATYKKYQTNFNIGVH